MNKKLLGLAIISALAFTGSAYANDTQNNGRAGTSYAEFGGAMISVEVPDNFEAEDYTFFSVGGGYNITENIAFQITGFLPMSAETQSVKYDTFRTRNEGTVGFEDTDFSDVQSKAYETQFESKGMVTADFKLTVPLHERFSLFAKVGYTYASFKHTSYDFIDNRPVSTILDGSDECAITGNETECGNPNFTNGSANKTRNNISESGFSYGAGFALHLKNKSSFLFSYNQYLDSDLIDAKGFQIKYQWVF